MKPAPSVHPSQFPMPVSCPLSLPMGPWMEDLTSEIHTTHATPGTKLKGHVRVFQGPLSSPGEQAPENHHPLQGVSTVR